MDNRRAIDFLTELATSNAPLTDTERDNLWEVAELLAQADNTPALPQVEGVSYIPSDR